MGIGYSTTNHESFSNNLKQGDFISADFTNDGSWDHSGFVTEMGGGLCTSSGNYINYKVAQHTSNYHEWVSSFAFILRKSYGKEDKKAIPYNYVQ